MVPPPAYIISPRTGRPARPMVAAAATLLAAVTVLAMPRGAESASIWAALVAVFPDGARSAFALGWASMVGCVAGLTADAVGRRRALRPALLAAIVAAVLSPAMLAVPIWPPLLAAAALIAVPEPPRRRAANDNCLPTHVARNPFALAA